MSNAAPPPRPEVMGPYRPDWLEKPTGEDMSAYYPRHAARNEISGKVTIRCQVMADGRLQACVIKDETPPGEQFGEAALKLSRKFRMIPPSDPNALPGNVTIPMHFQVPPRPAFTAKDHQILVASGLGLTGLALAILLAMIFALGRYHNRKAGQRRDP